MLWSDSDSDGTKETKVNSVLIFFFFNTDGDFRGEGQQWQKHHIYIMATIVTS